MNTPRSNICQTRSLYCTLFTCLELHPRYVKDWYSSILKIRLTEMGPGHPKLPVVPKTTEGQSLLPITVRELLLEVQVVSLIVLLSSWNVPEWGESQGIPVLVCQVVYGMGTKDLEKQLGVPAPAMSGQNYNGREFITDTDGRRVSLTQNFRQRTNNRSWSRSKPKHEYCVQLKRWDFANSVKRLRISPAARTTVYLVYLVPRSTDDTRKIKKGVIVVLYVRA